MKDGEHQNYTCGKHQTLINRLSVYLVFSFVCTAAAICSAEHIVHWIGAYIYIVHHVCLPQPDSKFLHTLCLLIIVFYLQLSMIMSTWHAGACTHTICVSSSA